MSYEERNAAAALITSIALFTVYAMRLSQMYQAGRFDGPDAFAVAAVAVLWLIGAGIVATILVTILANILAAIVTGDPNPRFTVDERDRMIELRGIRAGQYIFGGIFIIAVIALARGAAPLTFFHMIVFGFGISTSFEAVIRLAMYRMGA